VRYEPAALTLPKCVRCAEGKNECSGWQGDVILAHIRRHVCATVLYCTVKDFIQSVKE